MKCYSSRDCLGEVLTSDGEETCCSPGNGLSYLNGDTCHECFSELCKHIIIGE